MAKSKNTKKTETKEGYKYYRKQLTNPDGSRTSIYGKTQSELAEKVKAYRLKTAEERPRSTMTVEEYAAVQLAIVKAKVAKRTYVGYEEKVRLYIVPEIGEMRLCDVRPDDLERTMSHCTELSASAYRMIHMLIRKIFKAAHHNGLIDRDPSVELSSKGGKPAKEKRALTENEATRLFAALKGLMSLTFVMIAYYCGLRREEILALKWGNIILDTETPYIRVCLAWRPDHNRPIISETLKSLAAARRVPIPDVLTVHLREVRKTCQFPDGAAFIFCGRDGSPLSETQYRHLWRQVTRRTTLPRTYSRYTDDGKTVHTVTPKLGETAKNNPNVQYTLDFRVTPHQLRHTYVTNLIYAGLDPKTVQYLAGHENIKITMDIYAKVKYHRPEDLHGPVNEVFKRLKLLENEFE